MNANNTKYKKGQIAIEYLLLTAIGLAMLSISIGSLLLLKDSADKLINTYKNNQKAKYIQEEINILCSEQEGSSIEIKYSIKGDGRYIRYKNIKKPVKCFVEGQGRFAVKVGDSIVVSD